MVPTLMLSLMLVVGALAVVTATVAAVRRQRHLIVYASGYAAGVVGLGLLSCQGWLHPALSVVLGNLLICWFPLGLFVGLQLWMGSPRIWPRRYTGYVVVLAGCLVVGTTVWPSFQFRATAMSALSVVATLDVLVTVRRSLDHLPRALQFSLAALGAGFLGCSLVRIVLLFAQGPVVTTVMTNTPVNVFTYGYMMVFCILWVGLVLIIDGSELVVALEAKNAELATLATTDALTGVGNRQALDLRVQAEMERAHRYGQPLGLVMFDLDFFKTVNDTWGHETGDQVLRAAAQVVRALIRDADAVFRWGGEEFVLLVPHSDLDSTRALAEKLRLALAAVVHPKAGTVTASFGVSEWDALATWELWFHRADQALYRAKGNGRNRVEVWTRHAPLVPFRLHLEWSPSWESGNQAIDQDHRHLIDLANRLLGQALTSTDPAELTAIFHELVTHIADHFAAEEAILDALDYPEAGAHRNRHHALVAEVRALEAAHRAGEVKAMDVFQFVVDKVILDHMLTDDADFFAYTRPSPAEPSRVARSRS